MRDADRDKLKANLASVEERIAAACARAGRKRSEMTLVAVTKYVDVDVARILLELGVTDLGESRPQELWHKVSQLPTGITPQRRVNWHLVGHLQRNKVEETLRVNPYILIHSVDSVRLIEALDGSPENRVGVSFLLEFNLSGESSKHGFTPSETPQIIAALEKHRNLFPYGLMTMAALDATPDVARRSFAQLRELRDKLVPMMPYRDAPLADLSMGMTNDFEIAIEEGATLVRIGSALFDGLETRAT